MSDALFSAVQLSGSGRAGYRLHHLEVFNWGTFDRRVWRMTPGGDTSLLTGDIGSGKSTLVDAVTTLLLPAHRITYNKAAGAESRERSLRSYVEGHYKSERVESTGTSKAIGLRDHRTYSVILGVFVNEGYDETVSLAQVFHQRDRSGQPDRFFVTSDKPLSVDADFTDFGSDLHSLRRRLRATGATISPGFPDYSRHLRRLLGIRSEQALELFHQTVSMKSVGNLNDFVRSHMLEPVDASDKVAGIVSHFEDLRKAHEAVRRAEDQLAALEPLVATADRYDAALQRRTAMERERDAVRLYFAELRVRLLSAESEVNEADRERLGHEAAEAEVCRAELTGDRERLIGERAAAGGDRVGELERIEQTARGEVEARRARRDRFAGLVVDAGLSPIGDAAAFATLPGRVAGELEQLQGSRRGLDERLTELAGRRRELDRLGSQTRAELSSLAGRRNNLPRSHLDVRVQLCHDLGLDPDALPFAGELVDVADGFERWRGAAERVLRGFALSLLVPQEHYPAVTLWVDERRLTYRRDDGDRRGMRLVYERVPRRHVALQPPSSSDGLLLAQTLELAPGPFEGYLRDQLARRADHRCTESLQEFQQASRAVTAQGQVRSGDRHEKDDRSRIDDPRTWVLGWANERKIEALTAELREQQVEFAAVQEELEQVAAERQRIADRTTVLAKLEEYPTWRDLDWLDAQARADAAQQERARLVAGSSRLEEIERQLRDNEERREQLDRRLEQVRGRVSVLGERIARASKARELERAYVDGQPADVLAQARDTYGALTARLDGHLPDDAEDCQQAASELTTQLQAGIDRVARELDRCAQSLLGAMNDVRRRWPEATTEMDASVEARGEFRAFRDRVAEDDLPAFEQEFKRQLNTNTIRELAGFNSWLRRQAGEIHARVDRINEALGAIDYSPGRYITLVAERTVNQEVQAFRTELRAATDDTLGPDDDRYSEQRFLDVQRIIERFRGREGHAETDKAWTRRVTDVRNWFTFSAAERDRESGEEWEHYRDSDGKSGGQKEKLAYTILAASLAYQFGLEWGVERARDFRFVVIDEAFGRGSDASTRYALDLFGKLGLQLLIVTPLQKVHVIEPYVRAIGFVDNPTGSYSRLQTLTIEEFRARREGAAPAT
ncbi:MAG: SbcC/MukB-like Walker B domain-containing protein [Mycobacteriales bacterium]